MQTGGKGECMQITTEIIDKMKDLFFDVQKYTMQYFNGLKDLSDSTQDNNEQEVFELLGNAMSLGHDISQDDMPFGLAIILRDRRSFDIADFIDADIKNLKIIVNDLHYPVLVARVADLLWTMDKSEHLLANKAVEAYKICAEETFDKDEWVTFVDFIKKAYRIAIRLGKTKDPFIKLLNYIDTKIREVDGTDMRFFSIVLIELMIDSNFGQLQSYVPIMDKIIDDVRQKGVIFRAAESFELKIKLLRKLGNSNGVSITQIEHAEYIESLARQHLAEEGLTDFQHAVHYLETAVLLFRQANKPEDEKRIRLELDPLRNDYVDKMPKISQKIDMANEYLAMQKFLEGRSLQEKVITLGMMTQFHTKQELENDVMDKRSKFFFSQMFTSTLLDNDGKVIANIPPLDLSNPKADIELLEKHMHRMAAEKQSMLGLTFLSMVLSIIRSEHGNIVAGDLDFLVEDNWFIPEDRKQIFKTGFALGLNGDYYSALHLLVPQTENLFREIVKLCGGLTTNLRENRTEEWKMMTSIFNSEELNDCYDENIIFIFKGLLIEDTGANLRNRIAHGMVSSGEGNGTLAIYFLVAIIKLCSWYSRGCLPMLRTLKYELETLTSNFANCECAESHSSNLEDKDGTEL